MRYILLILLLSSCSLFTDKSIQEKKLECIERLLKLGSKTKSGVYACEKLYKRY